MDGGGIPIDLIKDFNDRFVRGDSNNQGNGCVLERVQDFSTEVVIVGWETDG